MDRQGNPTDDEVEEHRRRAHAAGVDARGASHATQGVHAHSPALPSPLGAATQVHESPRGNMQGSARLGNTNATNPHGSAQPGPSQAANQLPADQTSHLHESDGHGNSHVVSAQDTAHEAPSGAANQGRESQRVLERALAGLNVSVLHGSGTAGATTSATGSNPTVRWECDICSEKFPFFLLERVSCGHRLCQRCLIATFEHSLIGEWNFPATHCDMPITLRRSVSRTLSPDLVSRYISKKQEVSTVPGKRMYCHVPRCSTFISRAHITRNGAKCLNCAAVTCVTCKEEYHDNGMCTKKNGVPGLRDYATGQGWQICNRCGMVVERDKLHSRCGMVVERRHMGE